MITEYVHTCPGTEARGQFLKDGEIKGFSAVLFSQQVLEGAVCDIDFDKDKEHCYGPANEKEIFHNVGDLGRLLIS